jgi:uncharacterized protein YlaN (UPF0358 family)
MVPSGPLYSEEDAKEMHDMFPSVDLEVIKCVLDEKRGNKVIVNFEDYLISV